jgi:hypothetical protein
MMLLLTNPIAALLLSFSLLSTPVTYRGGAAEEHPHNFLQFLIEGSSGNHHSGHDHPFGRDRAPSPGATELADSSGPSVSALAIFDAGSIGLVIPWMDQLPDEPEVWAFQTRPFERSGRVVAPDAPPPQSRAD